MCSGLRGLIQRCRGSARPIIEILDENSRKGTPSATRPGIMPGAFDPMTNAHAAIALTAEEKFHLDDLVFLLDLQNADKDSFGASLEERLWLVHRFCLTKGSCRVGLSSHGLFVEKLTALKELYPENSRVHFIVGMDTLARILEPGYYKDPEASLCLLFEGARFIVASRGTDASARCGRLLSEPMYSGFSEKILFMQMEGTYEEISSTMVRDRLKRGLDVDRWIPQPVAEGIRLKGLYGRGA